MFSEYLSQKIIKDALNTHLLGGRVDYLRSTRSTMDEARKAAQANAPEGTLIVAEEQTGGRGRFQRTWISPPGVNLYISLILRPGGDYVHQLPMMASLALSRALVRIATEDIVVTIKWPNDVRLRGKKTAGILIENSIIGDDGDGFSIIGMGVNVNFDPWQYTDIKDIATSLQRELGYPVSRSHLLNTIMEEMEELYIAIKHGDSVREEWALLLDTLGSQVRAAWGDQVYEGYAHGVDDNGALILRNSDGSFHILDAGEVTLQHLV